MEREWSALLERYGQAVVLRRGETEVSCKAFLQPIRDTGGEQQLPSPLGLKREDRFLYLGGPGQALELGDQVAWRGGDYEVVSTHPICLGAQVLYIWAVLRPMDKEALG